MKPGRLRRNSRYSAPARNNNQAGDDGRRSPGLEKESVLDHDRTSFSVGCFLEHWSVISSDPQYPGPRQWFAVEVVWVRWDTHTCSTVHTYNYLYPWM